MAEREQDRAVELIERGDIFFIYRPKVDHEEAAGFDDVERFYIVLRPQRRRLWRLIVIGRKPLPGIETHERNWGFVDRIFANPEEVREELSAATYSTKTRGKRHLPPARPAGEGAYGLAHEGRADLSSFGVR
ncbi:MAG: hypothetical protein JOY71_08100 [Acetobacteraceae bacterium]|nr:hypothetical protein [Acetobacteraceae bacterium]MBV8522073.1 hypothetical protein [Acetobacteraceae bacterium]